MTGKKEGKKVQGPPKRVFFSDEENDAPSSPALSNLGSVASRGSQSQRATASSSQSQPKPNPEGKKAPSPAQSASTPVPAAAPTPATPYCANPYAIPPTFGQFPGSPTPFGPVPQGNFPGPIGPFGNQFTMAAQFHPPSMTPMPVCPPDKMGPPAPPLPPPAILPVVNPYGVHFQPQVPATDQGPMTHQYVPRYDPPGICYQAPQMSAYMTTGGAMHMQPMHPMQTLGVAPMTAPVNPIVLQQPVGQPMMMQNPAVPANVAVQGQQFLLPGPTMTGNNPFGACGAQLPAQPPVHMEDNMGVGLTLNETMAQNIRKAQNNKAYEPQDFTPADPDPYRMYWLRELNGHWAVFPRRQIDRLEARWYRTDEGIFYAVRLTN